MPSSFQHSNNLTIVFPKSIFIKFSTIYQLEEFYSSWLKKKLVQVRCNYKTSYDTDLKGNYKVCTAKLILTSKKTQSIEV